MVAERPQVEGMVSAAEIAGHNVVDFGCCVLRAELAGVSVPGEDGGSEFAPFPGGAVGTEGAGHQIEGNGSRLTSGVGGKVTFGLAPGWNSNSLPSSRSMPANTNPTRSNPVVVSAMIGLAYGVPPWVMSSR